MDGARAATFVISATPCPQLLCRLLGYIAQQERLVEAMDAAMRGDAMRVSIRIAAIDTHRAQLLAEKMRMLVQVRTVTLSHR